jgi:hypothetical protein
MFLRVMTCPQIIKSGVNKGKRCNAKVEENYVLCNKHNNIKNINKTSNYIDKRLVNKETELKQKILNNGILYKYKIYCDDEKKTYDSYGKYPSCPTNNQHIIDESKTEKVEEYKLDKIFQYNNNFEKKFCMHFFCNSLKCCTCNDIIYNIEENHVQVDIDIMENTKNIKNTNENEQNKRWINYCESCRDYYNNKYT